MRNFGTIIILSALATSQVSCSILQNYSVEETYGVDNHQLEAVKQYVKEARENLPITSGYMSEYRVWSVYKNYVGLTYKDGYKVASYRKGKSSDNDIQNFISYVRKIYNDQNIKVNLLDEANTWGDWAIAQQALFNAANNHIIPDIQGVGINSGNGHIIIKVDNKDKLKAIMYIVKYIGIQLNLVDFEIDRLVFLGGKTSGGSETTGTLPVRVGSLVKNDKNDTCTVGGFANLISTNSGGFIIPAHCIVDTNYSDLSNNFKSSASSENVGKIRYFPTYLDGTNIDAVFIALSTTSYKKALLEGKKQENYYNEMIGTKIITSLDPSWKIIYRSGEVSPNTLKFYGGMHGLNIIQVDYLYDTIERVEIGNTGIQALLICAKSSSPYISLGKGDSGSPVLDSNNQIVGMLSSVSSDSDNLGRKSYCFTATGEIQKRMSIKLL